MKADGKRRLRGDILREVIEEDIRNGLIPFYVSTKITKQTEHTADIYLKQQL